MSAFKKRGLLVLLAAAVLCLAVLIPVLAVRGSGSSGDVSKKAMPELPVLPAKEVSFSLNGEDYPLFPVLQDFMDRGWKLSKPNSWAGGYVDGKPTGLIVDGYVLTNGESKVYVSLKLDDCKSGLEPGECRLKDMSIYGSDVYSFCLDGKELSTIDSKQIIDVLGEPGSVEKEKYGEFYYYGNYFVRERGITEISFSFPYSAETVQQILVTFEG